MQEPDAVEVGLDRETLIRAVCPGPVAPSPRRVA